jgi:hypothetical protein
VVQPAFRFRRGRVRSLRELARDDSREQLARELSHRIRGEALLREATHAALTARDSRRDAEPPMC